MASTTQPASELFNKIGSKVDVQPYLPGDGLPVFLNAVDPELRSDLDAATSWFRDLKSTFDRLLSEVGAIVLRDFPISNTADFNKLVEHLPSTDFGYSGGNTRREPIEGRVFEATALPASQKIILHQEMAYLRHFPSQLAFFCAQPAETGGETIICDMRRVQEELDPRFVRKIRELGLIYLRNFRSPDTSTGSPLLDSYHKTWVEAFYTKDKNVAESACRGMGLEYEWLPDGSMGTTYRSTGFASHPLTGQEVYFNQIHAMTFVQPTISDEHWNEHDKFYSNSSWTPPFQVKFGDGSPMPAEDVRGIYRVLDKLTVTFPWRPGDVMVVDNVLSCHGRNSFTGKRDVQVALIR